MQLPTEDQNSPAPSAAPPADEPKGLLQTLSPRNYFGLKLAPILNWNSRKGLGLELELPLKFGADARTQLRFSANGDVGFPDSGQYPIGTINFKARFDRLLNTSERFPVHVVAEVRDGRGPPDRTGKTSRKRPTEEFGLTVDANFEGAPTYLSFNKLRFAKWQFGLSTVRFIPHGYGDRESAGAAMRIEIPGIRLNNTDHKLSDLDYNVLWIGSKIDFQTGGGKPNQFDAGFALELNPDGARVYLMRAFGSYVPERFKKWMPKRADPKHALPGDTEKKPAQVK